MAHNDFALDHNVRLDEKGRRMSQKNRKKAARGAPSESSSSGRSPCRRSANCALDEHPELKLIEYNYLPEYISSDHRPVFARFQARVPNSWFQLPVKFLHFKSERESPSDLLGPFL